MLDSSFCLIGEGTLLIRCAEVLLARKQAVIAVVSHDQRVLAWCGENEVICFKELHTFELYEKLPSFDYLISIVNKARLSQHCLSLADKLCINYHDSLLPSYAGRHATSWAIYNQEKIHGVTWHIMDNEIDVGDILQQLEVDISARETALSLNLKCYKAAITAFDRLLNLLLSQSEPLLSISQDLNHRSYNGSCKKFFGNGFVDWNNSAEKIDCMFRALDFGSSNNPLGVVKFRLGESVYIIRKMSVSIDKSTDSPGTIVSVAEGVFQVATLTYDMMIQEIFFLDGVRVDFDQFLIDNEKKVGGMLPSPSYDELLQYQKISEKISQFEPVWVSKLFILSKQKTSCFVASSSSKKHFLCVANFLIPKDFLIGAYSVEDKDCLAAIIVMLYLNLLDHSFEFFAISQARTLQAESNDFFSYYLPFALKLSENNNFSSLISSLGRLRKEVSVHFGFLKDIFFRYQKLRGSVHPPFAGFIFGETERDFFDFPITVLVNGNSLFLYVDQLCVDNQLIDALSEMPRQFMYIWGKIKANFLVVNKNINIDFFSKIQRLNFYNIEEKQEEEILSEEEKRKRLIFFNILKKIFSTDTIRKDDDFFSLGGDSIAATSLVAELNGKGFGLSLGDIFKDSAIKNIFSCVKVLDGSHIDSDSDDFYRRERLGSLKYESVDKVLGNFSLLPVQEGMIFQTLRYANSGVYFVQVHGKVLGDIDMSLMKAAWQVVFRRHDIFQIAFDQVDGKFFQRLSKSKDKVPWFYYDWKDASSTSDRLRDFLRNDRKAGFCLSNPPLIRLTFIKLDKDAYYFVMSFHHAILDGWSISLLFSELESVYKSRNNFLKNSLPCRSIFDYLSQIDTSNSLAFWRKYLGGLSAPTEFFYCKKEVLVNPKIKGKAKIFSLSDDETNKVNAFSKRHKFTLNAIFQSLWALLLSFYSQNEEVIFGAAVSVRPLDFLGSENTIGPFINTIPLRVKVEGSSLLLDFIYSVQKNFLSIMEYRYTSLVDIKKAVNGFSSDELFRTMLIFENYPDSSDSSCIFNMGDVTIDDFSHYPLVAYIFPRKSFNIKLNYNAELISDQVVDDIVSHFRILINQLTSSVDVMINNISMLSDIQCQKILSLSQGEPNLGCNLLPHQHVELYAIKNPKKTALFFNDQEMTYLEFNQSANQLAHYLLTLGLDSESLIAVWMDNSIDALISILAILKAGCAYVPIDSSYPEKRVMLMLSDSCANYLVSTQTLINSMGSKFPDNIKIIDIVKLRSHLLSFSNVNPGKLVAPDQLMYVIYTSGSTGNPKGVMIEHRNVNSLLFGARKRLSFGDQDIWTLFHSIGFDFSVWEIWGALMNGASLVIVPKSIARIADDFHTLLLKHKVTVLSQTPSAFYRLAMVDKILKSELSALRYIIFDGEVLQPEMVNLWFESHSDDNPYLINMYGITEATVHLTSCEIKKDKLINGIRYPIGKGFSGVNLYVLDQNQRLLPLGFPGELYVGGDFLSRAYINPYLSSQRFFEITLPNDVRERVYKTGDLVRRLENGDLDYLGRIDNQVKFRGFRIELDEISAWLMKYPDIIDAVTVIHQFSNNHKVIVSYYVSNNHQKIEKTILIDYLKKYLPAYMFPSFFIFMDKFPLNSNGKVDRFVLPSVKEFCAEDESNKVSSHEEKILLGIWKDVLGLDAIQVDDNFFTIGGNSILALQVLSVSKKAFSINFPMSFFFEFPSIAEFAENIPRYADFRVDKKEENLWANVSCLLPLKSSGSRAPLFLVHPVGGSIFWYASIPQYLDNDYPLYGIQDPGLASLDNIPFQSIEEMAGYYVKEIREIQPVGPYYLGGASGGSVISFEMARQILAAGESVKFLGLLDGWAVHSQKLRYPELFESIMRRQFYELRDKFAARGIDNAESLFALQKQRIQLLDNYHFCSIDTPLTLFKASKTISVYKAYEDAFNHWSNCSSFPVQKYCVPGDHETMFQKPHITVLINQLNLCLNERNGS